MIIYTYLQWHKLTQKYGDDISRFSRLSGFHIDGFNPLIQLSDALTIRKIHHIAWPQGISREDGKKLEQWGNIAIADSMRLKTMYCPMGSTFIKTITDKFKHREPKSPKWILYSAHDSTLLAVMNMLGAPMTHNPPYASDLNFSLFERDNTTFVDIHLNGRPVFVPACGGNHCSVEQLEKLHC